MAEENRQEIEAVYCEHCTGVQCTVLQSGATIATVQPSQCTAAAVRQTVAKCGKLEAVGCNHCQCHHHSLSVLAINPRNGESLTFNWVQNRDAWVKFLSIE